jgi:Uncharacterized conserved protein (DUF2190)
MAPSKTRNYIQDKGYNAAAALTKFRAVKFSAAETVTPVTAITDTVAGVVQHDVSAGEILKGKGASIAVEGDSVMEAAGAIAIGVQVCIAADGRALTRTTGNRIIGHCVEAATGAGDFCRVHLNLDGDVAGTA